MIEQTAEKIKNDAKQWLIKNPPNKPVGTRPSGASHTGKSKTRAPGEDLSGGEARDRAPEGRLRTKANWPKKPKSGSAAPCIVGRRVQFARVDAGHCPLGAEGPFCAQASGRNTWAGD